MLNLDPAKLFVIIVIAFVVLGPERLPRVARQLGAAWRELTRIRDEVTEEVRSAFPAEDLRIPSPTRAISGLVEGVRGAVHGTVGGLTAPTSAGGARERAGSSAPGPRPAATSPTPIEVGLGEFALSPDDPSLN